MESQFKQLTEESVLHIHLNKFGIFCAWLFGRKSSESVALVIDDS